jgi:hypothetical protein
LIIPFTTIVKNVNIDILKLWDYTVQNVNIRPEQFPEKQKQAKKLYENPQK